MFRVRGSMYVSFCCEVFYSGSRATTLQFRFTLTLLLLSLLTVFQLKISENTPYPGPNCRQTQLETSWWTSWSI